MVCIFQLSIINPAIKEIQYRMGYQAKNVLNQRSHVGISCFSIGMNCWGKFTPFSPCKIIVEKNRNVLDLNSEAIDFN